MSRDLETKVQKLISHIEDCLRRLDAMRDQGESYILNQMYIYGMIQALSMITDRIYSIEGNTTLKEIWRKNL